MADVQVNQSPPPERDSGGAPWVWAVVVIIVIALIAWWAFSQGAVREERTGIDVRIETPTLPVPEPQQPAPVQPAPAPAPAQPAPEPPATP
jgi:cell division septation protein DedD